MTTIDPKHRDTIYLRNLHVTAIVGKDTWQRDSKPQPIVLSIRLVTDIAAAGESDDINETISYGKMCKDVQNFIDAKRSFDHLLDLNVAVSDLASTMKWGGTDLHITSSAPKALLMADGGLQLLTVFRHSPDDMAGLSTPRDMHEATWSVHGLRIACIIGVNPHERLKKQNVVVSLTFLLGPYQIVRSDMIRSMKGHWADVVGWVTSVG